MGSSRFRWVAVGLCLAVLAGALGAAPALAKADGRAVSYLHQTKQKLAALRRELFANLTAEHQAIEAKIDYMVRPIWRTRAFARHQGGYREVILYGGLIAVLQFVTDAQILERHFASPGCFRAYLEDMLALDRENRQRVAEGNAPRPIRDVFAFAQDDGKSCRAVAVADYQLNPAAMAERAALLKGGVAFLMAHEVAHHLLGHVDRDHASSLELVLAQSRKLETEADHWAFKQMAEAGLNPIQAFTTMMFAVATNGWSAREERWASHPSGVKRFRSMLRHGKKLAARGTKFHAYLKATGQLDQWRET